MAHRAAIAFAEWVDRVQLVDVVAEPIEEILARKAPKLIAGRKILECGGQGIADIGGVRKQTPAFADVHRAVLPGLIIHVLE